MTREEGVGLPSDYVGVRPKYGVHPDTNTQELRWHEPNVFVSKVNCHNVDQQ